LVRRAAMRRRGDSVQAALAAAALTAVIPRVDGARTPSPVLRLLRRLPTQCRNPCIHSFYVSAKRDMEPFEYRSVGYWSKETNTTIPGGRKGNCFIRVAEDATIMGVVQS